MYCPGPSSAEWCGEFSGGDWRDQPIRHERRRHTPNSPAKPQHRGLVQAKSDLSHEKEAGSFLMLEEKLLNS